MKHIIIGTAGHVDHGKTTLIRALTGIETDRLREERERGMSIELGFAHLDLPGSVRAGIVDVPGHQRFIKAMLMGATGMDLALLVVAADEGVMPQTREHFDILRLLGVRAGLVALTRADMADPEWTLLVADEVRELVAGSFLDGAPIIPVSALTGQGMDELTQAISRIAASAPEKPVSGPFRMPIDRVFTMPGFGTVVTGTLCAGEVRVGDAAELLPDGLVARVRQIQVHGESQDRASAGCRVALNLAGANLASASRGDMVAARGSMQPTNMVDVRLELLETAPGPLASGSRVRFHAGSAELMGRLALLDQRELKPGDTALAQIRLEAFTAAGRADRFVLRRYSPGVLLGGGVVLDPNPQRHRKGQASVIQSLRLQETGGPADLAIQALTQAGPQALAPEQIQRLTGLSPGAAQAALDDLQTGARAVRVGARWTAAAHIIGVEQGILERLRIHHADQPLQAGQPMESLRADLQPRPDQRVYAFCIERLKDAGQIVQDGSLLRLPGHHVRLEGEHARAAKTLAAIYRDAGMNPPSINEALAVAGATQASQEAFDVLERQGEIVRLTPSLFLHRDVAASAVETIRQIIQAQGPVSVSQIRDALGSSRKVIVPFAEYLDTQRITRRQGDKRELI